MKIVPDNHRFTFRIQSPKQITTIDFSLLEDRCDVPEKEGCKGSPQSASATAIRRISLVTPLLELQTHTMQDYVQIVYFLVQVSFNLLSCKFTSNWKYCASPRHTVSSPHL